MDFNYLMGTVLSGLSALVLEDVTDGGDAVVVAARTRDMAVPCPVCGIPTAKVHGYHRRSFRALIPGLLERHQRRTVRFARQISQVARELCGRAAARPACLLAMPVSRSTMLRHLRRLPLPRQAVPRVIGVDDFALRRRHRYTTITTDAETSKRLAVLPDRGRAQRCPPLGDRSHLEAGV